MANFANCRFIAFILIAAANSNLLDATNMSDCPLQNEILPLSQWNLNDPCHDGYNFKDNEGVIRDGKYHRYDYNCYRAQIKIYTEAKCNLYYSNTANCPPQIEILPLSQWNLNDPCHDGYNFKDNEGVIRDGKYHRYDYNCYRAQIKIYTEAKCNLYYSNTANCPPQIEVLPLSQWNLNDPCHEGYKFLNKEGVIRVGKYYRVKYNCGTDRTTLSKAQCDDYLFSTEFHPNCPQQAKWMLEPNGYTSHVHYKPCHEGYKFRKDGRIWSGKYLRYDFLCKALKIYSKRECDEYFESPEFKADGQLE